MRWKRLLFPSGMEMNCQEPFGGLNDDPYSSRSIMCSCPEACGGVSGQRAIWNR